MESRSLKPANTLRGGTWIVTLMQSNIKAWYWSYYYVGPVRRLVYAPERRITSTSTKFEHQDKV